MKTSELKVELYELEFVGWIKIEYPIMYIMKGIGDLLACVDLLNIYSIDTTYFGFDYLKDCDKERLLRLLFMYAITPVNERGNEDGY